MATMTNALRRMGQFNDISIAVALAIIIGMMLAPLPPLLLDALLILNIAVSFLVLLIAMYITEPLEFSAFPPLLLIITLFRLGLTISASRMILSQAKAGQVIAVFGSTVIGGNYVVGVVVFLTLLIIQFMVITNGAGRVAEVAARFTLDAMPGKQMSIDADLNSGLIDDQEARRRRRAVELEADFYGAMDGASKFVKGDAIASIVVVVVNIVGGFVIGMVQLGMDAMQALQIYALLTVGQGLATQVPSLLISTATGLIVTRSGTEESLGSDIARQLANPSALLAVSGLLAVVALLPGAPRLPLLAIGAGLGGLGLALRRMGRFAAPGPDAQPDDTHAPSEALDEPEAIKALLQVDPLTIELGFGLIPLVDESQEDNLLSRVTSIRRQLASELGIILPKVRIRDNLHLSRNQYCFRLRGAEVGRGELMLNRYLAMPTYPDAPPVNGIETTEPAFGLPAWWVEEQTRNEVEPLGYTVVDALSVLVTHLSEIIKTHAPQLLSLQDVRELVDGLKQTAPAVVEGIVPDRISLSELQDVLRNLLRERVPIRDLATILETMNRHISETRDPDVLSEAARRALAYTLSDQYAEDGVIHVVTLEPRTEARLADTLQHGQLRTTPDAAQRLLMRIGEGMETLAQLGHQPLLLCSAELRLPLARLAERSLPTLVVLSYHEISPHVDVQAHAMVALDDDSAHRTDEEDAAS